MKRSNIIIISAVLLPLCWLLLSGWLQANAFNIIKSGKPCSYANIVGDDNIKQLPSFKNINIDFEANPFYPPIVIQYAKNQGLSFSKGLLKDNIFRISGDTLYLRINYKEFNPEDYININVPVLNSVNMSSASDWPDGHYTNINHNITISGFDANTLSINNNCQHELRLFNNKLKKLILKGDFHDFGKVEITNYTDYDSLDVDIQGIHGTLSLYKNSEPNENPKQWISIKVPRTFLIEAPAEVLLMSKITIKK